jgi:hypothetical protein
MAHEEIVQYLSSSFSNKPGLSRHPSGAFMVAALGPGKPAQSTAPLQFYVPLGEDKKGEDKRGEDKRGVRLSLHRLDERYELEASRILFCRGLLTFVSLALPEIIAKTDKNPSPTDVYAKVFGAVLFIKRSRSPAALVDAIGPLEELAKTIEVGLRQRGKGAKVSGDSTPEADYLRVTFPTGQTVIVTMGGSYLNIRRFPGGPLGTRPDHELSCYYFGAKAKVGPANLIDDIIYLERQPVGGNACPGPDGPA